MVVTGLGVTSPLAVGADALWEALGSGASSLEPTPASPFGAPVPARAHTLEASGFEADDHVDPRFVRRLSRVSAACLVAAVQARGEASPGRDEESGVFLGTAFGSGVYHFEFYRDLFDHGLKEASPLLFSESVVNAATGHICHYLGFQGPGLAFVAGEDSGAQAILQALDQLVLRDAPFVLAGGTEEYVDLLHASLAVRDLVGEGPGTPLRATSSLCALGEGAAFLRLEREEDPGSRGRDALAELRGGANLRARSGESNASLVERTTRLALEDAGVAADAIGFVVSGARGRPEDLDEIHGIAGAGIGQAGASTPVLVPKAHLGEAYGFTSAAQAVLAAQVIARGQVPAEPGEEAAKLPGGLFLPSEPVSLERRAGLVVSMTPTGGATVLVLGSADS